MVKRAVRLLFGLQVSFVFMLQPTAGFLNFHFSRLCVISSIPILHVFSLGQTYTVADKKTGISEEPVCGVVVPLIGKLLNVMKIWH